MPLLGFAVRRMQAACFGALLAVATATPHASAQAPAPRTGPTDPSELEAFLDGLMDAHLEEFQTAGAVVSVVKDGELFFAKGYGYADNDARKKVDAERTLFRIGSVSKLFVWTTVMQLVEDGKLDLDTDINDYLRDVRIPDTYPEAITLRHLMSHSAGFEDWIVGLFGNDESDVRPLGEILSQQTPARVRPPGEVSSYSNHGTGMAAHIAAIASGRSWNDLVEQRILEPLGMRYTTFEQPVPDRLAEHLSKGYAYASGRFVEKDFEWIPLAPVGGASASAGDMARFMIAHLQRGRYGEGRILGEETATRMQSALFRMAPGVNPMAYGFIDLSANGEWIIGHGGDTFWFHTGLALFPEHDLGVFVAYNSKDGGGATSKFLDAFVDRYFPEPEAGKLAPPEDFAERAARFTGHFRSNRFSHTSLGKLAAATPVTVRATDEEMLHLLGHDWVEVAPLTFREVDGDRTVVFRDADDGTITHFFLAQLPIIAFERVPAGEGPGLHLFILIVAGLMTLGTVLAWPVGWLARKWYGVERAALVRMPVRARLVLWSAAALFLVFALGMASVLAEPERIAIEIPTQLRVLLALPILAAVLTLAALYFTIDLWRRRAGRLLGRLTYSLVVLSFCLFLWQLNVWNLLGWRF